jgi:hypothetical protein
VPRNSRRMKTKLILDPLMNVIKLVTMYNANFLRGKWLRNFLRLETRRNKLWGVEVSVLLIKTPVCKRMMPRWFHQSLVCC